MDLREVVLVFLLAVLNVSALRDLSDIPGRYCETRNPSCCTAREDDCSVRILDTLCYCDEFCDRAKDDDCCPDYAYVCRNTTRPTPGPIILGCIYNGRNYPEGVGVRINCNECKCQRVCQLDRCRYEMSCSQNRCLVDIPAINAINQDRFAGWKAANYSQFWGRTLNEGLTRRLGTRHSRKRAYTMRPVNAPFDRDQVRRKLFYDLRQVKRGMISPPLDQGWCAADWVISTVQIATDRLAIVSNGVDRTFLSPQHLLSCNAKNQRGCDGGHLTRAWKFIQWFGLVPEECYPWVGRQTNCSVSKIKDRKKTTARCSNGNSDMPLHRSGPTYRISREPEAIMNEIMTSGPVQATMRVVSPDFFSYRSGVYKCPRSRIGENYHAVRIIGWGEEDQRGQIVKYWIVSNSWGQWWGEDGYFRIVRGTNECEIESLVLGSWVNPIVPKRDPSMPMMDATNMISNNL